MRRWAGGTVPGKAFHLFPRGSTPLPSNPKKGKRPAWAGRCAEKDFPSPESVPQ